MRLAGLLLVFVLVAAPAFAEEAEVQAQRPPHYVGDPVLIRVTATGFDKNPQPKCACEVDTPGLSFVRASPNVSTFVQITNGRRVERHAVEWRFDFHLIADEAGVVEIGPFVVDQGGKQARTGRVRLEPRPVPLDPDMTVSLRLPDGPVFPGQRVSVEIEWAFGGELSSAQELNIRSSLFDRFSFEDEPVGRRDNALPLTTAKGVIRVRAEVTEREIGGKVWTVLKARRTLVPDRSGTFDLGRITSSLSKVTRWERTFFGDRVAAATERVRAEGEPLILVVEDLPREGRPPSWAGAIGRGFTLEAAADRTVVRVGDPITLTLTLRGDGNLETAGLPPLTDAGLDAAAFRLLDGDVPGRLGEGHKVFEVTVRVADAGAGRIPALAYSWYDPETGTYETARSDPIALQVRDAPTVTADDVVSAAPEDEREPRQPTRPAPRYDVTDVDLAIRRAPDDVLVSEGDRFGGVSVRVALYALGLLLVLLAWVARARASVDPVLRERRALVAAARRRLDAAEDGREAAGALRAAVPLVSSGLKAEIETLAAEFDAAAYRPGAASSGGLDAGMRERAHTLLRRADEDVG